MLRVIELTPNEARAETEDFLEDLGSATISARAVTATKSDGTSASSQISGVGGATSLITWTFGAGATDYEDYTVKVKATLDSGTILERVLEYRCRSNPLT